MKEILQALQHHGLPKLTSYFERPVSDPSLLRSLRQRADAFEFLGHGIPCPIVPELTYDMGSRRLNSQLFMSVIDMPRSKGLMEVISRKLGYEPTTENTGVALVVERRFAYQLSKRIGKPAWRSEELLIVIRLDDSGLVSQHLLTPATMKSLVVPSSGDGKLDDDIKQFNALVPHASELIRGLNDSAIAWNGKEWGLVQFVLEGNLVVGNRAIGTGKFGQFRPADLGQALRIGMAGRHAEYNDRASQLMIPAPVPRSGRPGFRDWIMQQNDVPVVVGTDIGDGGTGSGGGGGGGGQEGTDITWLFSGTGTCDRNFSSTESCYSCCDTMGGAALAVGLTSAGAITVGVGQFLVPGGGVAGPIGVIGGIIATVATGLVLVVAASVVAYSVADACKDACDTPLGIGRPTVSSGQTASGALIT